MHVVVIDRGEPRDAPVHHLLARHLQCEHAARYPIKEREVSGQLLQQDRLASPGRCDDDRGVGLWDATSNGTERPRPNRQEPLGP
uniref:Uncharacterized protein n=1 Tax=uncultured marine virus TaxID=186617 RepID=A0A0F7L9J0_9VIRU|nr:hypothetical protein [uncultured marine virus]